MANILILGHHLTSVMNGGLSIARRLVRKGHTVRLVAIPDQEDRITKQGFEYRPFLAGVYPKGRLERLEKEDSGSGFPPLKRLKQDMLDEVAAFQGGDLTRAAEGFRADLVIGCADHPQGVIAAARLGVPVVDYLTKPYSIEAHGEPPLGSPLVPEAGLGYRVKNFLAWRGHRWPQAVMMRVFMRLDYQGHFRAYAKAMGFDPARVHFDADYNLVRLDVPHLVLWPEALEFPRKQPIPELRYLESSADVDRAPDTTFSWDGIDPAKPLIYCSLGVTGTFVHPGRLHEIFARFLEALATRPQWQGMLSVGEHEDVSKLKVPANVRVYARVPQIDVLKRASVFVTQGGAVSLGEAFTLGIPMVLAPLFFDQWGLSARVAFHGLGVRASESQDVKAPALTAAIERVLGDASFKRRATEMATAIAALEQRDHTSAVVESFLRSA